MLADMKFKDLFLHFENNTPMIIQHMQKICILSSPSVTVYKGWIYYAVCNKLWKLSHDTHTFPNISVVPSKNAVSANIKHSRYFP